MDEEERKEYILDLCARHNCSEKIRKIHYQDFLELGRHPHPIPLFAQWWEPNGFAPNGASRGGHPEAYRAHVRVEDGERRWYGKSTVKAWNTAHYRAEWKKWILSGMPQSWHDWDSTTAPIERQIEVLRQVRATMDNCPF